MSDTKLSRKRCECESEAKWIKCPHPWYMTRFYWGTKPNGKPQPWEDSISRWAEIFLNEKIETRTRAEAVAKIMRGRIVDGTYHKAKSAKNIIAPKATVDAAMTLAELVEAFDKSELQRKSEKNCSLTTQAAHRSRLARLVAYDSFGARAARSIDTDAMIDFRQDELEDQEASTWAKYFGVYVRLFHYGQREGVITKHPLDKHGMAGWQWDELAREKGEHRIQRLTDGQEAKILHAALVVGHSARAAKGKAHGGASLEAVRFAAQRMHDLIVGALETAGRKGELLALRWTDVCEGSELTPKAKVTFAARETGAAKTGIGKSRAVRMSTRFRAVLLRRRINALTGEPYRLSDYVFGTETGEKLHPYGIALAWKRIIVLAAGHTPKFRDRGLLTAESAAIYREADLHFHDLRRECASRWLASGLFKNLKQISELLGHTNVATTEIYLNVKAADVDEAMARYDAMCVEAETLAAAVGSTDDKVSTNDKPADPVRTRPRLIKGRNSGDRK